MPNAIKDLTDQQAGSLIVLKCLGSIKGRSVWKCRCEKSLGGCGEIAIVRSSYLVRAMNGKGGTKSCGCLIKKNARLQAAGARAAR